MGGKKKKEPEVPQWAKVYERISAMPPADISPFLQAISQRFETIGNQVKEQLEQQQTEKLKGLQLALANALGTTQYNPYAIAIKNAFAKIGQEKIQPLQQTQQQIAKQYASITPDVSKVLRMSGAYQKAGFPEFASAYNESQKFLSDTKDMLKNLGLNETEIENAMKPYYNLIEQGMGLV